MLRLDVEAVDVVEPAIPGFRDDRERPPVAGGVGLAMRHAPLNDGVAHHADAVRVRYHHWAFYKSGLFDPCCTGHFAVAVQRPPAGKYGTAHGILSARKNRGDPGAHGALADLQFSFARNQRSMADDDAGNISDGIERAGRAVKRDAEITRAWFCREFVLSIGRREGRE